ncbi:hypothetical protein TSOC_010107 [Tetrabaena socialis]|uniref:Uncharacterized protein n=1 Tax=Tetrabaena socialis TaxID=47790 RepID=A0A2J7ZU43_9CHLO|nr:hypothetical protein TSOC_010107 [Tetrabaena socialis]|eukprot:PNH03797.1 hypothetical protein TSOC_010107 [Tetrabaena socialis]
MPVGLILASLSSSPYAPSATYHPCLAPRIRTPAVEQRLADWTMTPIWAGEALQVLRYREGQKYDSHGQVALVDEPERAVSNWTPPFLHDRRGRDAERRMVSGGWGGAGLGGEAGSHWFFNKEGRENGGNRWSTVLMYLTDTEEGGETVFPKIPAPNGVNNGFSACAKFHLAVKPRKGDGERAAGGQWTAQGP